MKITLLTHRFLPRYFGGVETYALRLAQALQTQGHPVQILTGEPVSRPNKHITRTDDEVEGIPVTRLKYDFLRFPVTSRAAYADPAFTTAIRSTLAELKPDIVHATSLSLLMGGAIEAACSLELPLVYTATDFVLTCRQGTYIKPDNSICSIKENPAVCTVCMGPQTGIERRLAQTWRLLPASLGQRGLRLLEKITGKRADFVHAAASIECRFAYLPVWRNKIDHIIAPSSYMRDMLVLNNFPPERIIVSPYGVEPANENFSKKPSSKTRIGFIGRITFVKGVHLLLEAFASLSAQQEAHLTIYGEVDEKSKRYGQALKDNFGHLPNITFAGRIDNASISQVYRQLDVLVVPSIWPENSPITILEAQAHGVPVIASDVSGIADLIQHEVNGLIFANQNAQDLAHQMARCLDEPGLVCSFTQNSKAIKLMPENAQEIVTIYRSVLSS